MPILFAPHKNLVTSTVLTAPSPATSGTTLVLASGSGASFPSPSTHNYSVIVYPNNTFPNQLNSEVVTVTALSTDTMTIVRGAENSTVRSIIVGDNVSLVITAKCLKDIEDAVNTVQSSIANLDAAVITTGILGSTHLPALGGDVSSSAGSNNVTLATVNSNVGSFGDSRHVAAVTVNAKGLVTAASSVSIGALTGDVTASAGSGATTLATVNSNVGSFGDTTHIPVVTVNAKGLVTAVSTATPPTYSDITDDATNHRIGILTSTPAYTLDVAGDLNFTGTLRKSGTAVPTFPDITDDNTNHRIGVYTTTPAYTLDVNGIIGNSTGDVIINSSTPTTAPYTGRDISIVAANGGAGSVSGHQHNYTGGSINITAGTASAAGPNSTFTSGNVIISAGAENGAVAAGTIQLLNGNVGINVYPLATLHAIGESILDGKVTLGDYNNNNDDTVLVVDPFNDVVYVNGIGSTKFGILTSTPAYVLDVVGDINTSTSFKVNGLVLQPHLTVSTATSGTVTASTAYLTETIYLSSSSTISSVTIALPTTTVMGQILRIHSKSIVTTLSVTGGSFADSSVTSMTAGQTISYQAFNTSGGYIRI